MAMSKYETIIWEEKMKEQILSHARIAFADKLAPTSTLDIISTEVRRDFFTNYISYVIMVDPQRTTECKVLLPSEESCAVSISLEKLLKVLRKDLVSRMGKSRYILLMSILLYGADAMFFDTEKLAKEVNRETRAMVGDHSSSARTGDFGKYSQF
ncbi:hypothetical protein ACET3X_009993 [Alternaria dauci]|uniref:Uncharacterized protein n=1 Tax=Alternaria dauci TaxID=48095 RepID=A0ABR3U822_9PLEO